MIIKWLIWVGVAIVFTQSSSADVLVLNDASPPIHGLVVSVDESEVLFSVYSESDQTFLQRRLALADVKQIIRTVDQQRLEQLSIERLSDYRDLAEELGSLDNDPVARRFAFRLILLCLFHADQTERGSELRRSAAANLVALGGNENQRRQSDLIAFLAGLDINNDPPPPGTSPDDDRLDQTMLAMVTAVRRQQFVQANRVLDSELGQRARDRWQAQLDPAELTMAIQQQSLSNSMLEKLLAIEIRIRSGNRLPGDGQNDGLEKLVETHRRRPSGTLWFPQLREFGNFDLEKSEFRRGRWSQPD